MPEGDKVPDGGLQAQLDQTRGAQTAKDVSHPALHVGHARLDGFDLRRNLLRVARCEQLIDHRRVHADGEQVRADVVVQIARKVGALLVLKLEELFLQRAVPVAHARQLPRHQVECAADAGDLGRAPFGHADLVVARADEPEGGDQFVERPQRLADQQENQSAAQQARQTQDHHQVAEVEPGVGDIGGGRGSEDQHSIAGAGGDGDADRVQPGVDQVGEPSRRRVGGNEGV